MTALLTFLAYFGIATLLFAILIVAMHGKDGWKGHEDVAILFAFFCYIWPLTIACFSVIALFSGVFWVARQIGRAINPEPTQ